MRYVKYDVSKDKSKYTYKLAAFSGKEKYMDQQSKELYCAVVACTTESSSSCGKRFQPSDALVPSIKFMEIQIKMTIELETTQNDYLAMPTNVDFSILPLDTSQYRFERSSVYSINK
jgi:Vanin C-terminal domain